MSRRLIALVAGALFLGSPMGVGRAADAPLIPGFRLSEPADFSALEKVEAFRKAHDKMAREYAFTAWRGIDWPGLYARVLPAVEEAGRSGDDAAYFLALNAYISGIDDGHVMLSRTAATAPLIDALIARTSGGSVGLGLARLDDGRVIAARVVPGESADRAGIRPGAQVLDWAGLPIDAAIGQVDLSRRPAAARVATEAHRRLEQTRLITRLPVGEMVAVRYLNPGSSTSGTATLVAVDDQLRGLDLFDLAPLPSTADEAAIISSKRMGDVGYIRLAALADITDLTRSPEFIWDAYAQAIEDFKHAGVRGLILDLRGNHGGFDALSLMLCGTLYDTPAFYEATVMFNDETGTFDALTVDDRTGQKVDALMIAPGEPRFSGPVAVLINPRTISSAEGLARCAIGRPGGAAVGFFGTRGSFGLAGSEICLPAGIVLHYPFGRVVDRDGKVMIDSRAGVGGVAPTVRVPLTADNALAHGRGEDVELQYALRWLRDQSR